MICRIWKVVTVGLLMAILSGCWDRTELNDMAFVLSSAVDLDRDGSYRITYMLPLPGQMGGAGGGGGGTSEGSKGYYIDSESGLTLREASAKLQRRMSRSLFLSHRRTLLIGEEMAKQGIDILFDTLPRLPESRLSTFVIVTKGPAYKLLNAKPKFERFPAEAIRELSKSQESIKINAKNVAMALSFKSDPIILYMGEVPTEKAENKSREIGILGYAQFKGGRMVGVFSEEESKGLMWLRLSVEPHSLTVLNPSDKEPITLELTEGIAKIKPLLDGDQVLFTIKIDAKVKVRDNLSRLDMNQTKDIHQTEQLVSDAIKRYVQLAFDKMQKNGTDSVQLGNIVWRHYPGKWEQRLAPEWNELLKQCRLTVDVATSITDVGLINQNVIRRSY